MAQCLFLPNSVTVLILTTPICCGTIESPLVPSSPTRWRQLAVFPLAWCAIRLTACAHGWDSAFESCPRMHTQRDARGWNPARTLSCQVPDGERAAGAELSRPCTFLTHSRISLCRFGHCVHTHQQEVMSVPVTWETETVAKIPWQWVLVSELFLSPAFTWTRTDRH